ncbi:hypothetical protein ACFL2Q_03360 [Thermodesulfobacteriota bacterium]
MYTSLLYHGWAFSDYYYLKWSSLSRQYLAGVDFHIKLAEIS